MSRWLAYVSLGVLALAFIEVVRVGPDPSSKILGGALMLYAGYRVARTLRGASGPVDEAPHIFREADLTRWDDPDSELAARRVPRRLRKRLQAARDVGAEVERRLQAAGFETCAWLKEQNALTMAVFSEHARSCASCAARDRFAREVLQEQGMSEDLGPRKLLGGALELSSTGSWNVSPWVAWLISGGLVSFWVVALSQAHTNGAQALRIGLLGSIVWAVGVCVTWLAMRFRKRGA